MSDVRFWPFPRKHAIDDHAERVTAMTTRHAMERVDAALADLRDTMQAVLEEVIAPEEREG